MTDNEDSTRRGRAGVRWIEAADVLLKQTVDKHEWTILEEARQLAVRQLRQIVRDSDPAITAEIMAASDKALGTVRDVMLN